MLDLKHRIPHPIQQRRGISDAIQSGHRTGPLRWCSIEITDQKAAEVFVGFARRKLAWLTAETPAAVLARRTLTG